MRGRSRCAQDSTPKLTIDPAALAKIELPDGRGHDRERHCGGHRGQPACPGPPHGPPDLAVQEDPRAYAPIDPGRDQTSGLDLVASGQDPAPAPEPGHPERAPASALSHGRLRAAPAPALPRADRDGRVRTRAVGPSPPDARRAVAAGHAAAHRGGRLDVRGRGAAHLGDRRAPRSSAGSPPAAARPRSRTPLPGRRSRPTRRSR